MSEPTGSDRLTIWVIVASHFGPAFMFSGVAVALPSMGSDLHLSATELGLIETMFLASSAAFLLPAGRLTDATGRRTLFRCSFVAFALLTAAIGLVSSGPAIVSLRGLQGIASALFSAAGPAILLELVPSSQRGRIFGAVMSAAYVGLACGPLVAGWLVEHLGWRSVFLLGTLPMLFGAALIWWRLPRLWLRPVGWVHGPSLWLQVAVVGAVLAATSLHTDPMLANGLYVAAMLGLVVFVWLQRRVDHALLDVRDLWANKVLRSALLVQLLLYLNAYCSIFMLSVFLQVTKGMPPVHAGLVLVGGSLVMACVAPFAGRLADRVRPQLVAAWGVVAVVCSSVLGVTLTADASVWRAASVLLMQGLGFGLFSSPNLAIILGAQPRERGGMASALGAQSRGIGMFIGMATIGAFLASNFGGDPVSAHPERVVGTMHSAYTVLLVSSVLALVSALLRVRPRPSAYVNSTTR